MGEKNPIFASLCLWLLSLNQMQSENNEFEHKALSRAMYLLYMGRLFCWGNPCEQSKHVCGICAGSALLGDVHVAVPGSKGCSRRGRGREDVKQKLSIRLVSCYHFILPGVPKGMITCLHFMQSLECWTKYEYNCSVCLFVFVCFVFFLDFVITNPTVPAADGFRSYHSPSIPYFWWEK